MSKLSFNDGVAVNTSGPLRPLKLVDGWYVAGNGYLIPVKDEEEAYATWRRKFTVTDIAEGQVYEISQYKTRFRVVNLFEGKIDKVAMLEAENGEKRSWYCGTMLMDVRNSIIRLVDGK